MPKIFDSLKSPGELRAFSQSLMKALEKLDDASLREKCGQYLTPVEISTTLKRRDKTLEIYHRLINDDTDCSDDSDPDSDDSSLLLLDFDGAHGSPERIAFMGRTAKGLGLGLK